MSNSIKKTILVTGAFGQLGSEVRRVANTQGFNYIFTDVAELDITSSEALSTFFRSNKIDVVINCAAYTAVDAAEDNQELADKINHISSSLLATFCTNYSSTLIHVSTDYVFDGKGAVPYTEEHPTAPIGVYGATKCEGEKSIIASGCEYMIVRTAWLYSEFGNNFVKTMLKLTSERDSLKVVSDQIGSPTYAADLASFITYVVEGDRCKGNSGVYHYSNEGVLSWYDFTCEIARMAGNTSCSVAPCTSSEFPSRVTRPAYSVLDKTKVKTTFGVTVRDWREALAECLGRLGY